MYGGVLVPDGAVPFPPTQVSADVFPIPFPSDGQQVWFPGLRFCIDARHVPPRNEHVRLPDATAIVQHRDEIPAVGQRGLLPPRPQVSAPRETRWSQLDRW